MFWIGNRYWRWGPPGRLAQLNNEEKTSEMYPIDHLYRGYRRNPDGIAVEDGTRGVSYRELVARVSAFGAALQDRWPAPSARIGICAYNTIEHLVAILGIYAAGHTWVALNPRNGKPELDAIVETTGLDAIIADMDCLDLFAAPDEVPVILGRGAGKSDGDTLDGLIDALSGRAPQPITADRDAPQTIKFTGGSTGRPKGVLQGYRVVNTSVACYLHKFGFTEKDVNLCAAPLTHGSSHYILPILSVGGRHVLIDKPSSSNLLASIRDDGVTTAFMPPTMIYNVMGDPEASRIDLSKFVHLHYGAAPMPEKRIREARDMFGGLEVIYGQTEAPMMITAMSADEFRDDRNLNSVGRETLLVRTAVMDPEGRLLPAGEDGEIVVRGDLVMTGYLDRPDETAKTIVDGWLHTGDAGSMDDRGYLFIKERLRDIIISGGFNVYPTDVEAALVQHPAIRDCVVFSVPDEKWGERVEAAIELAPGHSFDEAGIIADTKSLIGSVKTPKRLHVTDQLPKSAVGKVLRREARERFGEPDSDKTAV